MLEWDNSDETPNPAPCRLARGSCCHFFPRPFSHSHGGIPRAFGIVFEPNKPDNVLLRSDVWGVFRSTDGGRLGYMVARSSMVQTR